MQNIPAAEENSFTGVDLSEPDLKADGEIPKRRSINGYISIKRKDAWVKRYATVYGPE